MLKQKTLESYKAIRKDFEDWSNKKEFGVQKYSVDWILETIAKRYFKSPKTIENIVFNRTKG